MLDALPAADRTAIESALAYPEETAGRIMQREVVAVRDGMTVGDVIDWCRSGAATGDFWEIFVVDPAHRPIGTCQLSWILTAPRHIAVSDLMKREQTLVPATMDQEEVALRFQRYNLISAAVVDDSGRLIGQITVDDIVHVIQEEAGEDVLLLSGAGEGDINEPIRESYKARVRWLIANMGTALVGSTIIWLFGAAIEQMVALAVLMPIVASIGGNAGTQTMAVSVRAISLNQLTQSNTMRIIGRELRVAVLNGATVAVLIGLAARRVFLQPAVGRSDRAGDGPEHHRGRTGRSGGARGARPAGPGPGGGEQHLRDDDHRLDRLPGLPGPGGNERAGGGLNVLPSMQRRGVRQSRSH